MSYISPMLRVKFESLPIHLKNVILERGVELNTLQDLMNVLEEVVSEGASYKSEESAKMIGSASERDKLF